jgi:O-antigen/teichoic acid export membrane protein
MATGGDEAPIVIGGALFALAVSSADTLAALHRGESRHDREAIESAMPIVAAAGAFSLVVANAISGFTFAWLMGAIACGLVVLRAVLMLRRYRGSDVGPRVGWLFEGRWFLARAVVTYGLFDAQTLLLQQLSDSHEVALYAIAVRPVGLMMPALSVLTFLFLPELSRLFAFDRAQYEVEASRLNLLHLCAIPAAFAVCVFGGKLMLHAAGDAYVKGLPIVAVATIGVLVYVTVLTLGPLIAARREREAFGAALVGLAVLAIASIVLVPRHGAMGMAVATVLSFTVTKSAHVILYRNLGLALAARTHALAYVFVGVFFGALAIVPASYRVIPAVIGGIVSVVVTVRAVARARYVAP